MSNERARDRGNLFPNTSKQKPSQPDFQGDCTLDGTAYEIRGWRREEDQLTVSLARPRGDRNTYPPDVFRGAFDAAPTKPVPTGKRGRAAAEEAAQDAGPVLGWSGEIESDDATYEVRAFEKQGKSGAYFTLSFARREHARTVAPPATLPSGEGALTPSPEA